MTSKEERIANAKRELEEKHRDRLVQALGQNFSEHPGFSSIVEEVAGGRYPLYAISERMGR